MNPFVVSTTTSLVTLQSPLSQQFSFDVFALMITLLCDIMFVRYVIVACSNSLLFLISVQQVLCTVNVLQFTYSFDGDVCCLQFGDIKNSAAIGFFCMSLGDK